MNKNQMIHVLRDKNGYPMQLNEKIIEDFLSVITECLVNGDSVQMAGFGVFDIRVSNPRVGTNPRTLEKMSIGHYARPSFRAGRALKAAIKNSDLAAEKAREVQVKKAQEVKLKKAKVVAE